MNRQDLREYFKGKGFNPDEMERQMKIAELNEAKENDVASLKATIESYRNACNDYKNKLHRRNRQIKELKKQLLDNTCVYYESRKYCRLNNQFIYAPKGLEI